MPLKEDNMSTETVETASQSSSSQDQSLSDHCVDRLKSATSRRTINKRANTMSAKDTKRCGQSQDDTEPPKKKLKGKQTSSSTTLTTKGFQRHFAKHNYHDYAKEEPTRLDLDNIKATRGGVQNPFPLVLHNMMEQAEEKGYSDIVSWQIHGRAFLIHKPKEFVAQVLPMFFKHSKLASFQRQLSLYGFIRLTHDGLDRGAYYHECFLRGRYFLSSKIVRTRVKGTWVRTSSSPESEPDFYTMEPVANDQHKELVTISDSIAIDLANAPKEDCEKQEALIGTFSPILFNREYTQGTAQSSQSTVISCSVDQEVPETFSDSISSGFIKELKRPASDAGLQPPPFFPTKVVKSEFHKSTSFLSPARKSLETYSMSTLLTGAIVDSVTRPISPTLSYSMGTQCNSDLSGQVRFSSNWTLNNDDDLAHFLLDVDLETDDFDFGPTGIQLTGV
jgi:hypothetical protein